MTRFKTWVVLALGMMFIVGLVGPRPTAAQAAVVPIIVGRGYLLGGSQNGRWVGPITTAQRLRGGERYRVYTTSGLVGPATGTKPITDEPFCFTTSLVTLTPEPSTRNSFAFGGTANPFPRPVQVLSNNTPVYREAVAAILRANGIANPDVRLTRVVRVDLEGDGVTEVIVNATRNDPNDPTVQPGDYSLLVIRKVIAGKVVTIPVRTAYFPNGSVPLDNVEHNLAGVGDLNGDGRMEIMSYSYYWEGDNSTVYSLNGQRLITILNGGCGV